MPSRCRAAGQLALRSAHPGGWGHHPMAYTVSALLTNRAVPGTERDPLNLISCLRTSIAAGRLWKANQTWVIAASFCELV